MAYLLLELTEFAVPVLPDGNARMHFKGCSIVKTHAGGVFGTRVLLGLDANRYVLGGWQQAIIRCLSFYFWPDDDFYHLSKSENKRSWLSANSTYLQLACLTQ